MPFQRPPRLATILAGSLAASLMLAVAGCSHSTPAAAGHGSPPPTSPLRSPFVLGAVHIQPASGAGACPAGSVALAGGPGQCYRPLGTPVKITSAAVGPVITDALRVQGLDGFWIILPAADVAKLQAITTTAADARANLDISVAGQGWLLPIPGRPFTNGQLEMFVPSQGNSLPSRNYQVLKLHRILARPS
jgi:hypothetical protein